MSKWIISLCDLSGIMVEPWVVAGYSALLVDPEHPRGINQRGNVVRIGKKILQSLDYIGNLIENEEVVFVSAFPPCTDVAVSGASYFRWKGNRDMYFQTKAALIAEQCRMVGGLARCPWFFENPVSVFGSIFGPPDYIFHPYYYTSFCSSDNYTKKTCLWTSSSFIMPRIARQASLGRPDDLKITRDFVTRLYRDNFDASDARSKTPPGFARAVFHAHHEILSHQRGTASTAGRWTIQSNGSDNARTSSHNQATESSRHAYSARS